MKRKRRDAPLIDDIPKRPKVQAQRKFAQNSNVNSPVITPIRDLEAANLLPNSNIIPEPVELLPMKRPNTEDFLTFLCFRGTPILPPSLNFFNTASIVTDGQVHEIKGDTSHKNGPIDIAKCAGTSSEKPFIAFGVRKRADPIVISKQMERKRRHALALQALRRRYQEQKMAKIRALTISKLSEKTTNKTTVKTNTIQKTETVTKKDTITLQKTKVIATKHVKVTTQTLKTALRPNGKQKMCLRSFRGKIVQKELPFRGRLRIVSDAKDQVNISKKKLDKRILENKIKMQGAKKFSRTQGFSDIKNNPGNVRVTRSNIPPSKVASNITRQKMKKIILLSSTNTSKPIVKPKLRSSTLKSTVLSQRKAKQRLRLRSNHFQKEQEQSEKNPEPKKKLKKDPSISNKKSSVKDNESDEPSSTSKNEKKELKKNINIKRTINTTTKNFQTKKHIDIKKSTEVTTEKQKTENVKKFKREVNKSSKETTEVLTSRLRSKAPEQKSKVLSSRIKARNLRKTESNSDTNAPIVNKIKKLCEDSKKLENVEVKSKLQESKKCIGKTKASEKEPGKKVAKASPIDSSTTTKIQKEPLKEVKEDHIKTIPICEKELGKKEKKVNVDEKTTSIKKDQLKKENADIQLKELPKKLEKINEPTTTSIKKELPKKLEKVNEPKIDNEVSDMVSSSNFTESKVQEIVHQPVSKIHDTQAVNINYNSKDTKELKSLAESHQEVNKVTAHLSKITTENKVVPKNLQNFVDKTKKEEAQLSHSLNIKDKSKGIKTQLIAFTETMPQIDKPKLQVNTESIITQDTNHSFVLLNSTKNSPEEIQKNVPDKLKNIATGKKIKAPLPATVSLKNAQGNQLTPNTTIIKEKVHEIKSDVANKPKDSTPITKQKLPMNEEIESEVTNKPKDTIPIKKQKLPMNEEIEPGVANKQKDTKPIKKQKLPMNEEIDSGLVDKPRDTIPIKKQKLPMNEEIESGVANKPKDTKPIKKQKLPMNEEIDSGLVDKPRDTIPIKKQKLPMNEEIDSGVVDKPRDTIPIKKQKLPMNEEIDSRVVDKPRDMIPIKKQRLPMNASVRKRQLKKQITEESSPPLPQRPSRKTKEAAAIYMEILSHKLVNDAIFDDDNISIDSFPELPNVRKTEQREIELKAQAKTVYSKDKDKELLKVIENVDKSREQGGEIQQDIKVSSKVVSKDKNLKKTNENINEDIQSLVVSDVKPGIVNKQAEEEKGTTTCKKVSEPKKNNKSKLAETQLKKGTEGGSPEKIEENCKFGLRKRKPYQETFLDFSSESDDEILQEKAKKYSMNKPIKRDSSEVFEKRQTRGVTQFLIESDSESDQFLDIDFKVQRKKKFTKSKSKPAGLAENRPEKDSHPKDIKAKKKSVEKESDESIESDTNLKSLQIKQSKKQLLKSQSKPKKLLDNYSDSDEKPLSKLTADKSVRSCNESEECKSKINRIVSKSPVLSTREIKPKRECAKRPQNYLPMPSSSEDEEYFHGFTTVKEEVVQPIPYIETLPPSLDLLEKDLGRKGKVNMSNEQIEKWLKDSALAGSGVAKENDEMLKFGEKIPVERSSSIEEEKLLPEITLKEIKNEDIIKPRPSSPPEIDKPVKTDSKSSPGDRKIIFKKEKKDLTPTISAFSPENECSVYAFGDDIEETVNTPFRRPSRRPSSTATSRSEDESSKNEELSKQSQFRKPSQVEPSEDFRFFNIPQNPSSSKLAKNKSDLMKPPKLHIEKFPEAFDEGKYKVPSSPSASSSSSAKLSKKSIPKPRSRVAEVVTPIYLSDFPKTSEPGKLVEAPVFHPTEQEFQDPLEYIERIRHKAEQFGICKIVPPSSFKPECKVSDEMRFTAYNQYVHKMLHRWGPNFKEFMAIKKYLATQNITLKQPPWIGGMEIDLPRLYQTVQSLGGLKEVIEKKKWPKVSDCMKIPKSAQDRVTKLDDIYCKYLLPYDTLSPAEREKLFGEVETHWAKRESKSLVKPEDKNSENSDEDEESDGEVDECIVKGRNMALSAFYRIARNTMAMHFKTPEPTAVEVEEEFWKYVIQKQNYICVHSASIDCGVWGYGFAVTKNSPFGKHAWNLKVLSNNNNSVLKALGPAMGVTVPTLHVGMVFSACCWYRDPHGLPWVEYLHTGGSKIWYGIPNAACDQFHAALKKLVPNYCRDKELWLSSDTAMVPPSLLMENNVSLSRTIQEPGQFIVVFPKVFTSSISTGYVVSESVYFAPHYWLKSAKSIFNELRSSCEPSMFSLDKLFIKIAADPKTNVEVLRTVMPYIQNLYEQEKDLRNKLRNLGKIVEEKITSCEATDKKKKRLQFMTEGEYECEICRTNLYVSVVVESQDDLVYCLQHALEVANKDAKIIQHLKLQYNYTESELEEITYKINATIEGKLQKKSPNKYAGMPTLLTK